MFLRLTTIYDSLVLARKTSIVWIELFKENWTELSMDNGTRLYVKETPDEIISMM